MNDPVGPNTSVLSMYYVVSAYMYWFGIFIISTGLSWLTPPTFVSRKTYISVKAIFTGVYLTGADNTKLTSTCLRLVNIFNLVAN